MNRMSKIRSAMWPWVAMLIAVACVRGHSQSRPIPSTPAQIRPILIGSEAPGPVLVNSSGEEIDLAAALEQRSTILVFYRAHW